MFFNSFIFLSFFLPFVLLVNLLLSVKLSNIFLLIASLFFYYWGEPQLILLLILSILWNYIIGIILKTHDRKAWVMWIGVLGNISVLFYYKYLEFFVNLFGIESMFGKSDFASIILPIGVSFFTFQGVSYIVDVFSGDADVEVNPIKLSLYISFFPQLVAGPIVKFKDISGYISARSITLEGMKEGSFKLIRGLFKKIVLANNFAIVSDVIFGLDANTLSFSTAWIGVVFYTLQIYFDFSGYSDIAIGTAQMMGFKINENFKHPYSATSFRDFWRRWHISLSTWFKEYVYIPLGGNRVSVIWTYLNLMIVFFVTGLWHGANITFIIWGLLHGVFLILDRIVSIPKSFPIVLKWFFVFVSVSVLWVFFRLDSVDQSLSYLEFLVSINTIGAVEPLMHLNGFMLFLAILGGIGVFPFRESVLGVFKRNKRIVYLEYVIYPLLLLICITELFSTTHQSFIYFKF